MARPSKRVISFFILPLAFLNQLRCSHEEEPLEVIKPLFITEPVLHDADDPAIWINKDNPSQSWIMGTDKGKNGALYVFDMKGRILKEKVIKGLQKPNNVDVAYGMVLGGRKVDIAVITERLTGKLRIYSLPEMLPVDNGGLPVFEGETDPLFRMPMGIGLYQPACGSPIYAIVSRKAGPSGNTCLGQYLLEDNGRGQVKGTLIRKFGVFSGNGEIEAIAVDNELGYIYYSDEKAGVRKYFADPGKGDKELALFATEGFKKDHEGISIYKMQDGTGYILVSDQEAGRFHVFSREGAPDHPHNHQLLKVVTVRARNSDGSDLANFPFLPDFPNGIFVAMSEDKTFHLYRWEDIAGQDLKVKPPALEDYFLALWRGKGSLPDNQ